VDHDPVREGIRAASRADKKSLAAEEARTAETKARLAAQSAEGLAEEQAALARTQTTLAKSEAERARREAKTYERVKDFMLEIFTAADPEKMDQGSVTARELLGRAAVQLELLTEEPEIRSALSLAIGSVYTDMALYREAGPLLEKALELRRTTAGVEPMLLAESLSELGRLRMLTHEHQRALELDQEALAIYQNEEPQGGLMWAMGLSRLGQLAKEMGEYVRAEDFLRQALEMRERCGDRTSESLLGAKSSLAVILRQLRRDDEAEDLMSQIVENYRAKDRKSVRLAVAISNLGLAKLGHGNPQAGEALVREAFEMKKDLLGDENPTMAGAHSNLAYACDWVGKRDESLQHYLRAIEMCERDPELNRVLLAIVYKNLARLHRNCGRLEEAVEACGVSIEIREAQVLRDETSLGDCYDNMGAIYYSKKEYKTSEEWTRKALAIYEREFGKRNMRTAMLLENVGACQLAQLKDSEAEATLLEAFGVLETLQAANPRPMRSTADFLARLYDRQGKTEEAAKYRAISTSKP
jgi:tetratricopeptide (TPR) repeat protein